MTGYGAVAGPHGVGVGGLEERRRSRCAPPPHLDKHSEDGASKGGGQGCPMGC